MATLDDDIEELSGRAEVRFDRLILIVERHFEPSNAGRGGSHRIYKTPWPGDPRINLQESKGGKAKRYQVRQVVTALQKLRAMQEEPEP